MYNKYKTKQVIVMPYDENWVSHFKQLKKIYTKHLTNSYLSIEHVGSTAIVGLAAKPVIDIDIIVKDLKNQKITIDELCQLGYIHLGDLGLEGRDAVKIPTDKQAPSLLQNLPVHNLYVCVKDSIHLKNHLFVRDFLRKNPTAVAAYGNLKLELADSFPKDIDQYIAGKTDFLLDILKHSQISLAELSKVEDINKGGCK